MSIPITDGLPVQNGTAQGLLSGLADMVHSVATSLHFRILEVGAAPIGQPEPFHQLLDLFPGSQVIAFEVDAALCDDLNRNARQGLEYVAVALGRAEETRKFYNTKHPLCSSLYPPNEELLSQYHNLEMAMLDRVTSVDTVSLDRFAKDKGIGDVDFIKIDIQGAELDVFQGGTAVLKDVVMIVSEVEFVPHYIGQPLFGEVCQFLSERSLMFQRFLKVGGGTLKPLVIDNNPDKAVQYIWTDALFIRNVLQLQSLTVDQLLKLAVLCFLYSSPDMTLRCLYWVDHRRGTNTVSRFLDLINAGSINAVG